MSMLDIFSSVAEKARIFLLKTVEDEKRVEEITYVRMSATLLLKISKNALFMMITKAEEVSVITKFLGSYLTFLKAVREADILSFQILLRISNLQIFSSALLRAPNYLAATVSYVFNLLVESDNAQVLGLARGFFTNLYLLECFCQNIDVEHILETLRSDLRDRGQLDDFRAIVKTGYESYAQFYSIPTRALTSLQLK